MDSPIASCKYQMSKLTVLVFLVFLSFIETTVSKAQNNTSVVKNTRKESALELYDSIVYQINNGDVGRAKSGLWRLLEGFDNGRFVECSQEHTVRLLQYKSHVILANIAFAEKNMWDLDRELSFFNTADTTQSEWKRARYAATHYKHKYYQLQNGVFGKVVGDWVSMWQNKNGIPMVWIRFYVSNNTLHAELK